MTVVTSAAINSRLSLAAETGPITTAKLINPTVGDGSAKLAILCIRVEARSFDTIRDLVPFLACAKWHTRIQPTDLTTRGARNVLSVGRRDALFDGRRLSFLYNILYFFEREAKDFPGKAGREMYVWIAP